MKFILLENEENETRTARDHSATDRSHQILDGEGDRQYLHLKFERADTMNRTDWFENANDKYGECMKAHADGVEGVFDMTNYWCKFQYTPL